MTFINRKEIPGVPWEQRIEIGNHLLYKGDCLEIMNGLSDVDLILVDPPYGTTQCKWDAVIPLEKMWNNVWKITKNNAAVVFTTAQPFTSVLINSQIKNFRYDIIWDKIKGTGFLNVKRMPLRNHEIITVFYRSLPTYNPQKTKDHVRKKTYRHVNHQAGEIYGSISKGNVYDSTERYPRSVITFSTDTQKSALHPTQKPVKLLEYLINTYSNEGDTVLDFTMGSGSTGIACLNTKRKFIGIEKDDVYFSIAHSRMLDSYNAITGK